MRIARPQVCAALTLTVAGLTAAPAVAASHNAPPAGPTAADPRLELLPAAPRPGDSVTARTADCAGEGPGRGAVKGLGAEDFRLHAARDETGITVLTGTFRTPDGARPGNYTVEVTCPGGERIDAELALTAAPAGATSEGSGSAAGAPGPAGAPAAGVPGPPAPGAERTRADAPQSSGAVTSGEGPLATAGLLGGLGIAAAGVTWLLHRRAQEPVV